MSELQEIEVTISPDGQISVHIHGVKGAKCEELTKGLEPLLGQVVERTRTDEYYETEEQQGQQDWA